MINFIASFAQDSRLQYVMLLQSLTGVLATALDGQNPDSGMTRSTMAVHAGETSSLYLSRAEYDLHITVAAVIAGAIADAGMKNSTKITPEHLAVMLDNADQVVEYLATRLRAIAVGNIAVIINELRRLRLTTSLLQISGTSRFGALMQARMGRIGELRFITPDSLGRKWRSTDFVASMISKDLMQLYVESFLYCAALDGDTHAMVIYPDHDHEDNGMIFTIAGDEENTFDNIKDNIWHPHSTAEVQRVHP